MGAQGGDGGDDPKGPGSKKYDPPHNAAASQADLRRLEEARQFVNAPTPPSGARTAPSEASTWTPTGEHPVTKNEFNRELKHAFNVNDLKQVVAMIVVAIATAFGAYKFVLGDARAQADAGRIVLEQKVEEYKKSTDASIAELKDAVRQMATKQEVNEVQQDIREFYRVWRDDKRSVRLEQPLDAGR